jgi:hypothetical protein
MGPHGVSIILISGQENSGEVAVAASVFLSMHYLGITPVSTSQTVRKEFLLSLEIFCYREYDKYISYAEEKFTGSLTQPNSSLIHRGSFWLALDDQGYTIGEKILTENGVAPDTTVYYVRILNQIEQAVPPLPKTAPSPEFGLEIQHRLYDVAWKHRRVRSQRGRRKLFDEHVPISPIEQEYYAWYASLYESLLPWKETIYKIQSDWS